MKSAKPAMSAGSTSGSTVTICEKASPSACASSGSAEVSCATNSGRTATTCEATSGSSEVRLVMLAIALSAMPWMPPSLCAAAMPRESRFAAKAAAPTVAPAIPTAMPPAASLTLPKESLPRALISSKPLRKEAAKLKPVSLLIRSLISLKLKAKLPMLSKAEKAA